MRHKPKARRPSCLSRRCQLELSESGAGQLKARVSSLRRVSWAHSAQGDVATDGMALRSALSIGGGSEEMSTRTEMVANGADRPQEALGVLGCFRARQHPLSI